MKKWRVNFILIIILLCGAAIIGRLFYLQIINRDFYSALAKGQQTFVENIVGDRGEIFLQDKDGSLYPLATNKKSSLVYISPGVIEDKEEVVKALAGILNIEEDLILEKAEKDNLYEVIKSKLTDEELKELSKLTIPGIYLKEEQIRYYPQESFAAHVSGFLGGNGIGQYGIEGYWDDILRGKEGIGSARTVGFLGLNGKELDNRGSDLILTIDYNIQYQAEKLLKEAEETLNIEGGEIIVIDPNTGKIIALAHFPGFNPNQYSKEEDLEIFQNGAVQKIFEPGSVLKPITMSAGIDKGVLTPDTTYTDIGYVRIGTYTIYNYGRKVFGEKTMTGVLEKSINTGAIFAENKVGHKIFLEYLRRFGFFDPTGIDLQGEVYSTNENLKAGYEVNFATASFGQGIEVTSMQLVRAFSAIANGGKEIKPYIVEKIKNPNVAALSKIPGLVFKENGDTVEIQPKISDNNIISLDTSSKVAGMMISVVDSSFGQAARIPGYYVAGKTGTAQVPLEGERGYHKNKTIQSFIGFLPALNPKFLVLVKLYNPETNTAEYSATPLFKKLGKYIIDYYQIAPDRED